MPLPSTLSAANYRAFARRTELELRPLTLLYGWNSAGKSALLRLLPLLGESVRSDATAALELSGEAGRGSSFRDVRWKGEIREGLDRHLMIGLRWREPAPLERLEYRLEYDEGAERVVIRSFSVEPRGGLAVEATRIPSSEEARAGILSYDVRRGGSEDEEQIKLQFSGLVPQPLAGLPVTQAMNELLCHLRGAVQWLCTSRRPPQRRTQRSGAAPRRLEPDGKGAAQVLRAEPEILGEVSAWFEKTLQRRLEVEDAPPSDFRLLLRSPVRPQIDVDLVDAGEGLIQVLPVLVAAAIARREATEGKPHILAVEEPESGLHPNAQRSLGEHLSAIAASPSPPTIVLETHAYALLLAIQLQILRGQLPHDRVIAYWVEAMEDGSSEVRRVDFDALGRPGPAGNWPRHVFADQQELAYEIAAEQLDREDEVE
ncbi:MAG TPA: AAA family ATPase [Candidatus Nanopelagicales bacterium]|nr:AAA family ATPase [Candidatus Nanopelagicales bacterium]